MNIGRQLVKIGCVRANSQITPYNLTKDGWYTMYFLKLVEYNSIIYNIYNIIYNIQPKLFNK